ncbi:response regulator [Ectothiorhodospira haloalkaliphila]|uniref:hybrid sensor histidine kinase/response regulator n=1 Tax=Ectothiorhodospira haloalkaliphila TaxID=421628 RepID=UPI001EE84440|nr:ATP-binding protein [Ectothiorhodospira haloalkaliphila]MCG5524490.1 response regulator [Ectothiorhodospira haloalkaliphila]
MARSDSSPHLISGTTVKDSDPAHVIRPGLLVVFMGIILLVVALAMSAWQASLVESNQRDRLLIQVVEVANALHWRRVDSLTFSADDLGTPIFESMRVQLRALAERHGGGELWTVAPRNGEWFFGPESLHPDDPLASPPGTRYESPPDELGWVLQSLQATTTQPYADEYGEFVSSLAPVVHPQTGQLLMVVGLDAPDTLWWSEIHRGSRPALLAGLGLLVVFGLGVAIVTRRGRAGVVRPAAPYLEAAFVLVSGLLLTGLGVSVAQQLDQREQQTEFVRLAALHSQAMHGAQAPVSGPLVLPPLSQSQSLAGDRAWGVGGLGMLFTVLATMLVMLLRVRHLSVEQQVKERSGELKKSQVMLKAITDVAQDAIVMMDPRGQVVFWNKSAERLFGYRRDEAVGRDLHQMVMPGGPGPEVNRAMRRFAQTGTGDAVDRIVEVSAQRRDGSRLAGELSLSSLRMTDGWYAVGIVRDVCRRKRMERRLIRLNECLASLGPDYQENVTQITQVCGELLESEAALYNRLKEGRLFALGRWRTPEDMPLSDAPEGHVCHDVINGTLGKAYVTGDLTQTPYAEQDPYVKRYGIKSYMGHAVRCQDQVVGSLCVVSTSHMQPTDEDERILGILAAALSAEEGRHLAMSRWQEAKEQADRANQAKSDFLSRMSHELRTPMNAVLGFSQLLEADPSLDEGQQESVREILRGGRHLLDLINEVLDLARVESGRIEMSIEPVPLGDVVRDCLILLRPLARDKGITIHVGQVDQILMADRTRLKQVLINLISNAIKYNRPHGEVWLDAQARAEDVRVRVRDTGRGVPESLRDALFQPFARLHEDGNESIEGTGIGLAISRRLVELMGGMIGMTGQEQGSCFWFELKAGEPAAQESGDEVDPLHSSAPVAATGQDRHFTVLHVDDNPANLRLVEHVLRQRVGVQVLNAPSGGLGLELARAHRPDLIILDINMPGMNGYDVLQRLRQEPETTDIPLIALTANATERDMERGREAGFDQYLTKPLDMALFMRVVESFLKARKADLTEV